MENQNIYGQPAPDFGALLESVKENGRQIQEIVERQEKERQEREKEREKERQEREKVNQELEKERLRIEKERLELEKKHEENNARRQAENDRRHQELENTYQEIRKLRMENSTKWSRLVEALCTPAALKLFMDEGIGITRIYQEGSSKKAKVDGIDKMEVDAVLVNSTVAVVVEVKSSCGAADVNHFLKQMRHFKKFFPEFADKTVYGAIAAIEYKKGAAEHARKRGLYTLQLSGEDTFTMQRPDNRKTF